MQSAELVCIKVKCPIVNEEVKVTKFYCKVDLYANTGRPGSDLCYLESGGVTLVLDCTCGQKHSIELAG